MPRERQNHSHVLVDNGRHQVESREQGGLNCTVQRPLQWELCSNKNAGTLGRVVKVISSKWPVPGSGRQPGTMPSFWRSEWPLPAIP